MVSIIFLDAPVGTGFSYARTANASHSTDIQTCDQTYEFMRKWFVSHPEFISNPFYVGGDSYSGRLVPILTQLMSNGNEEGTEPYINLKGYVLGNPLTFAEEGNYKVRFANGMGLISDELYKSLLQSCHGEYRRGHINPNNQECMQNIKLYQKCVAGVESSNILEPFCGMLVSPIKLPGQKQFEEQHPLTGFSCRLDAYKLVSYWAADAAVREALHIRKGTIGDWERCKLDVDITSTVDDVRPYHVNLSNKGYRSLIYSGDHDLIVTFLSTHAWIRELNYSVIDQWRQWRLHNQVAGYTESYSNMMTFATLKGGGHTAPETKPEECFAMFKRWILHQPL